MLPRIGITLGWVVVVALVTASARAQCRDGRVQTAEGECCWPAQTWSAERARCEKIRVLSVATLIGEAIGRTAAEESVSSLFDD